MSMYNSALKSTAEEFLQDFSDEDLTSLAKTATNNRITPETKAEAVDAILLHTPNVKRLLSYRRITTQKIFQYLHKKKVPIVGYASRAQVINTVETLWTGNEENKESTHNKKRSNESTVTENIREEDDSKVDAYLTNNKLVKTSKRNVTENVREEGDSKVDVYLTNNKLVKTSKRNVTGSQLIEKDEETQPIIGQQVQRSDEFSQEFCRWFYTMINRLQPECINIIGDNFREEIFSSNSSVSLYFQCDPYRELHGNGRTEAFNVFRNVVCEYRFLFSPNLESGIGAEKSPHGMVKVFCCGTLHQGSAFIGIFEQEFGVVYSPADQAWLIMTTKVNLKHTQTQEMPTLPPYQIFEITAS